MQSLLSRVYKHQADLETQSKREIKLPLYKNKMRQFAPVKTLQNLLIIQTTNTGLTFWEKEAPVPFVQQFWPDLALRNKVCLRDRCIKQGHLDPCLGWHPKQYEISSEALGQIFLVSIGSVLLCSTFHSWTHRQASTVTNLPSA